MPFSSTLARFCRHHRKHYIGPVSISEKSWLVQVFSETTPARHLVPSEKSATLPLSQRPYFWTFQNIHQDHRVNETVSTCHGVQRRGSAVEPISGSRHAEPPPRGVLTPRSTSSTSSLVTDEHTSTDKRRRHAPMIFRVSGSFCTMILASIDRHLSMPGGEMLVLLKY